MPAQKAKCNQDTPTNKIDSHTVRHKMLQLKKTGTCKTQPTGNITSTSRMNTPGKTKTLRVAALTRQTPAFMIWCFFVWILFAVPYLAAARFACKKKMCSAIHTAMRTGRPTTILSELQIAYENIRGPGQANKPGTYSQLQDAQFVAAYLIHFLAPCPRTNKK